MKPFLIALFVVTAAVAAPIEPFGAYAKSGPKDLSHMPQSSYEAPIKCLVPAYASRWEVEAPPVHSIQPAFRLEQEDGMNVLRIVGDAMVPGHSTVRTLLTGDADSNGDVWAKNRANYVSFLCKSTEPAQMTFHLLQHGKSVGTFETGFSVAPADWQRIVLPVQEFGLKSFAKVAGIGFRIADAAKGTEISIADIKVGRTPFTDDSWKSHRLSISLKGDWRFAADTADQGMKEKWYADGFNDSSWKVIKSGFSWQQQGVRLNGWGWYRQEIFVPKECVGTSLRLTLCPIPSDDEVWFDGIRIGGVSGDYKYKNWITRVYTVPTSLIRYGKNNTIVIRIWGGNLEFFGNKSGLVAGPLVATLNPYGTQMCDSRGEAVPVELFDLSDAQRGKPFEIVFPFPAGVMRKPGAQLNYRLTDYYGDTIQSGRVPLVAGSNDMVNAIVPIDRQAAHTIYLRGRFHAFLTVEDDQGNPLYCGVRNLDHLSFARRDQIPLPALSDKTEDTPYGKLKLVDEINCATSSFHDPHPYMESGFDPRERYMTPGSPVNVTVTNILGKEARECGQGWFAYRIGRGKLKPHTTYLLRIEYPEDKPRYCPIEIQTGRDYMDVGWKDGISPDNPYDNWPLSHKWQWYDVIVPLGDTTVGTGGTESVSAKNGFWVYFMNKIKPNSYFSMYSGGPAVAEIKLYKIDPDKNAPVIHRPQGLPSRILDFDWERQPTGDPADFCRYAKLMGYNAISPDIIKWSFGNYSKPLNGYNSIVVDSHGYWAHEDYVPDQEASSPYPKRKTQHELFLEATKRYGIKYIPRVEWGGSFDLPKEAWARDPNGRFTKPDRYAKWCADLLNPLTWDDLKRLMDHLIRPYVGVNPQLTGVLWRIRCDRLPISYGPDDVQMFCKETGTPLPPGEESTWGYWAAGPMKSKYDAWWQEKRAQFHYELLDLLKSYRSNMTLYYYNWDEDKFGLVNPSTTMWAFLSKVDKPAPEGGRAAYEKDIQERKRLTAEDYIAVMRSGNFGKAGVGINRPDYAIWPSLYRKTKGIEIFAPVDFLCYADKPDYLNYFQTADGLAVANAVSYDEVDGRSINPKFECNMVTPAGPNFSMGLELLAYFYGDVRTLTYTVYTYGRGFADAHRRFAQAFLALPAIPGKVVNQGDNNVKVRIYPSANGLYVGVAYKGYKAKTFTVEIPAKANAKKITNLVTGQIVPAKRLGNKLQFEVDSAPMELHAFLVANAESKQRY